MQVSKDSILAFKPKPTVKINVPEWGGEVFIRIMSGQERDAYEDETYRVNGADVSVNRLNLRARLLVRCLSDESGARIFASDSDAEALGQTPSPILDKLFSEAAKVNGITPKDEADLAKNSESVLSGGSGST